MAKLSRKKGITSQILHIFIQDSSSTTGAGLTALAFDTASLACRYINAGGTLSGAITLQTITTLGTYEAPTANTNMRFKEVSSASPSQGVYEIHIHNDWMNLTGGSLVIMLAGATNMAQFRLEIDLQADVNITHVAGTAQTAGDLAAMITAVDDLVDTEVGAIKTKTDFLPSILAGNAGGLMIAGSNAATTFATLTVTGATTFTGAVSFNNTTTYAGAVTYSNGVSINQATLNGHGLELYGNGNGKGFYVEGGATGDAIGVTPGVGGYGFNGNIQGNLSGSIGSVTGNVGGNVVGSVGSLGANAIDNNSLHSNACAKVADSGIQRGSSNWENNSDDRSLGWAISKLVNKVDLNAAGDTLTIRKSNDSTALFTQAVTTSGGATPITALDTA